MSTLKEPNKIIYDEFVSYVQSNQERFYRLAYSYVKNQQTSLDVIQNAIYNGLRSINSLKDPSYMKTWFYRILVNASLDEIRKNKRILSTDPFEMPENIVQESITRDEIMDLYQALEGLNPDMKTIVILRYFEDMKLQEIASILDLNISTVKTRLYSALEKLKLQLKSEVFNDE